MFLTRWQPGGASRATTAENVVAQKAERDALYSPAGAFPDLPVFLEPPGVPGQLVPECFAARGLHARRFPPASPGDFPGTAVPTKFPPANPQGVRAGCCGDVTMSPTQYAFHVRDRCPDRQVIAVNYPGTTAEFVRSDSLPGWRTLADPAQRWPPGPDTDCTRWYNLADTLPPYSDLLE